MSDVLYVCTRFSTAFSTIFSTIYKNKKNHYITNVLSNYWPKKLFSNKTSYTPPSLLKKLRSPSQMLLEASTFYHNFYQKLLVFTVDKVCNISNKHQPPNDLAKYQYFYTRHLTPSSFPKKKKNASSFPESFKNIHLLPHFY